VAAGRVGELAIVLVAAAMLRRGLLPRGTGSRPLLAAAGAGAIDVVANICYVAATRTGMFGLASLYPGVTVLMASRSGRGPTTSARTRSAWSGSVNQLLVHELVDAVRA